MLSPEERDQIRKDRETEGMVEYYGGARLNSMVSYLKSNSINKIRSKEIYLDLEVSNIFPMEDQPRKYFDQESLEDLKASIEEKGLGSPILVRREGERFQIIAGERRWRAFKELGRRKIPAIIKDVKEDKEAYILAAIENLQRENLNVIEEALCYKRMLDTGSVSSQKELATIAGRNKSRISERISLLKLPESVKRILASANTFLSEGHGIELVRLKEEEKIVELADRVLQEKMSRDQLRKEINDLLANERKSRSAQRVPAPGDPIPEGMESPMEVTSEEIDDQIAREIEKGLTERSSSSKRSSLKKPRADRFLILEPPDPPEWNVQFNPLEEQGFDLRYHFRPSIHQNGELKQIIEDMGKRLKAFKKLRREFRRKGLCA
jgi:ParB family chromosome partitioning protein